jgi:hypothetical protein
MHARLVARLNRADAATRCRRDAMDDVVLGLPGNIARVKIYQIVVLDPGPGCPAGQRVPDGLIEAAGDEPPLRQPQLRIDGEEGHEIGTGKDDRGETVLCVGRPLGHVAASPRDQKSQKSANTLFNSLLGYKQERRACLAHGAAL